MDNAQNLVRRLKDNRSKKVVFLSHCILNEDTRYLGEACRSCCVREIIEQCMNKDLGMVRMPCPEQHAWGGVTKRLLCMTYGSKRSLFYHLRHLILPLFLLYTKFIYRRLAREIAKQIEDYIISGFSVIGVVAIGGSPPCGVNRTLDVWKSLELAANMGINSGHYRIHLQMKKSI